MYVTSYYGWRVLEGNLEFHDGIDFAQYGGCMISAVYSGAATVSNWAGLTVQIDHKDGFKTVYGHARNYEGTYPREVNTNENIMFMGCTGRCFGTHLHFTLRHNGQHVNPWPYFVRFFSLLPIS